MRNYISILLFLVFSVSLLHASLPEPMSPPRLVNDFAGVLSSEQQQVLENRLLEFNNRTSTQIAIVTIPSLDGYQVDDYGDRLANKWKIGQQGKNNGLLVLLAPNERRVTIRVGYGLEDVIPDVTAKRIIENQMIPGFREGNYLAGFDSAITVLMALSEGRYTADEYSQRYGTRSDAPKESLLGGIITILLIVYFFLRIFIAPSYRGRRMGHGLPFWISLFLIGSGSGSSSSSSGSGGFGGFGGGSFGGGGASGGW